MPPAEKVRPSESRFTAGRLSVGTGLLLITGCIDLTPGSGPELTFRVVRTGDCGHAFVEEICASNDTL